MFKRFVMILRGPDDGGAGASSSGSGGASAHTAGATGGGGDDGGAGAGLAAAFVPDTGRDEPSPDGAGAGIPSGYQPFSLPDGMPMDQAAMDLFTPVARDLNLTQDQAQKLISLHAERMALVQDQAGQAWQQQRQDWQMQARVDPEFGGARFEENLALARRAIDRFGTPDLTAALNTTGAGDHPAMLKFFAQVARATGDHRLVSAGASGGNATMSTADYYAREVFGQ
ncbi:peptidase [Novispirillum itersonii]|uniref:peptidase n=1 Tax=Novispirillum itersonii TaxID=189 RepID=UPI00037C9B94|nr:peptidase [Novispirillum itersonii]